MSRKILEIFVDTKYKSYISPLAGKRLARSKREEAYAFIRIFHRN
jgi:hypothetical protein